MKYQVQSPLQPNLEFRFFVNSSAILQLIRDKPVLTDGGNRGNWQKPPPTPKSLATFSHDQIENTCMSILSSQIDNDHVPYLVYLLACGNRYI